MKGRLVTIIGAALHLPLAVMSIVALLDEPLFLIVTGPSILAACLAVGGVVVAKRRPRGGALLVLLPGVASLAWMVFLGVLAAEAWIFLLGVPVLPVGGWLMLRQAPVENPMPALPA